MISSMMNSNEGDSWIDDPQSFPHRLLDAFRFPGGYIPGENNGEIQVNVGGGAVAADILASDDSGDLLNQPARLAEVTTTLERVTD